MSDQPIAHALSLYFEEAGARVERDETFQENYGLDFSITRFHNLQAHVNLGVHLATGSDAIDEVEAFCNVAKRGITLKALYIEAEEATLRSGGMLVVLGACLSYLFDKRYAQVRLIGLRINEDCTFHFYELEECLKRLRRTMSEGELDIGFSLEGHIIAYFTEKGFGFIQASDDNKYFFHIANIVDDDLRERLPSYAMGETIKVVFQYGGHDGKKYPKAINVSTT